MSRLISPGYPGLSTVATCERSHGRSQGSPGPVVRTPSASTAAALAAVPPCEHPAATMVREGGRPGGVEPSDVGHAVFGNVIHTEDYNLGLVAAVNGGLPVETPAFTVNRLCGSGLQAIVSAAQAISLCDCDVAVAGGARVDEPGAVLAARPAPGASGCRTRRRHPCDGRRAHRPAPTVAIWASRRRTSPPSSTCPGPIRTRSLRRATGGPPRPTEAAGYFKITPVQAPAGRARSQLTPTSTSGPA